MTPVVAASAPAKIVLSGEYAVLEGAPAIGLAVDRRAYATATDIDGEISKVVAPGYSDLEGKFRSTANGAVWLQGGQSFALVDSVWRVASETTSAKSLRLDTRQFTDPVTCSKLGIGASAAVTVALCAALQGDAEVATLAHRAHSEFQGGAGSGIDIACSSCGGLIEYRMGGGAPSSLRWPADLKFRVLWSGVASSTTEKLSRLKSAIRQSSKEHLAEASERLAKVWVEADARAIVSMYPDYIQALRAFSVENDLGIFDAGHDRLSAAASGGSLVYKPCGAGGGDVGIVFALDEREIDAFVDSHGAEFTPLDCAFDPDGVRMETIDTGPE